MTAPKLTKLDMKELEEQLESAIQEDKKYWQQNEAKLQAVRDHVETYDEFKNLVDAAHLKPLDKSDKIGKEKLGQTVWNKFSQGDSSGRSQTIGQCTKPERDAIKSDLHEVADGKEEFKTETNIADSKTIEEQVSRADRNNFSDLLSQSDDKLNFLTALGAARFVDIFRTEISTSVLLEVLKVLESFDREAVESAVFVAEFLGELINIERFSLTVSFLTAEEKQVVESLFEKLNSCFILRREQIEEFGLDEDHLCALKIVYQL